MKKISLLMLAILFAAQCSFAAIADAAGIKERMKARIPVINALKAKGIVGENNKGFLEFRGAKSKADVVAAENKDRKAVYAAIAKQQGVSAELVGQRRAAQIAAKSRGGELYQKSDGSWVKK